MNKLLRIIDVNLNRSQEGLRVCEDIVRFILNDGKLLRSFKSQRHQISKLATNLFARPARASLRAPAVQGLSLLKSRNIKRDIGKITTFSESKRKDIGEVFRANIQRVKESLRVLEEVSKLLDRNISQNFKKIRFRMYELEKKSHIKLEAVLHHR